MFQKTLIFVVIFLLSSLLLSQTIENGSINTLIGWDTTSGEGRANGPYTGTIEYQALINSPFDENTGSGSALFTATGSGVSETQDILGTEGQEVTAYVDIVRDGTWTTSLVIALYRSGYTWDVITDSAIDIANPSSPNYIPPDTDGTLDSFTTVSTITVNLPALDPLGDTNYAFYIGTSNSISGYGGAVNGGKFAFDNVRINPPVAKASSWEIYQ